MCVIKMGWGKDTFFSIIGRGIQVLSGRIFEDWKLV